MKKVLLSYFLLIFFNYSGIANTVNSDYIPLAANDISDFVETIDCDYELNISTLLLESFMEGLNFGNDEACGILVPDLIHYAIGKETYKWDAIPNAINYTVARIGLNDGKTFVQTTTNLEKIFTFNIPQQYILFFVANCLDGVSQASIIIPDKDVFRPRDPYVNSQSCNCRNSIKGIPAAPSCDYLTSFTFPWDNICPANKYRFRINPHLPGEEIRKFYTITAVHPDDTFINLLTCSDNYIDATLEISEPGKYWVNFTSVGAHIYIVDPTWENATVNAIRCECLNVQQQYDPNGEYVVLDTEIVPFNDRSFQPANDLNLWPNPFNDQLNISLNSLYKGPVSLSIYDVHGQLWQQAKYAKTDDSQSLAISTTALPKGVFHLVIEEAGKQTTKKIIKM